MYIYIYIYIYIYYIYYIYILYIIYIIIYNIYIYTYLIYYSIISVNINYMQPESFNYISSNHITTRNLRIGINKLKVKLFT